MFALPHVGNAPVWVNASVAIVIFVMSLVPQATAVAREARAIPTTERPIGPPQQPHAV